MEAKNLLLCLPLVISQKHLCDPSLTLIHMLELLSMELLALVQATLHVTVYNPARIHHGIHTVLHGVLELSGSRHGSFGTLQLHKPGSL